MSLPKREIKSGCFYTAPSGVVFWKEYLNIFGSKFEIVPIMDLESFSRECQFKVLFVREFADSSSFRGKTKSLWAIDYRCHLAENVSENIYLKYEKSKKIYFVRDVTELGQTCAIGLDGGQPELIISKSEPYKVTQAAAKEIMETSGYNFGKCDVQANGELEFYTTV
jgi:hypothetical protein